MALSLAITDAGHAAIINAQNSGTDAVSLTEVGFGTRTTAPSASQVGLTGEIKRVDTIAGVATGDKTISVRVTDSSGDTYSASEIGLFTDTGVLFAVYAQSSVLVSKSGSASLMLAIDLEFSTDGVVPVVVFGDSNFVLPAATEDVAGSARIATQAQTDDGTDDARIVTPLKLKNALGLLIKQATTTITGIAEIATQAETDEGTDDSRFVTPLKLKNRFNALLKQATIATAGIAEIATQNETDDGSDDSRIVTPLKLKNRFDALLKAATEAVAGIAEIATQDETDTGTDDTRFVTPKKLRWGFTASLGSNGYLFLPTWLSGFGAQWGSTGAIDTDEVVTVNFGLTFSQILHVSLTIRNPDTGPDDITPRLISKSVTNAVIRTANPNSNVVGTRYVDYIAFGAIN